MDEYEQWLDRLPLISDDELAEQARLYAADECASARTIEELGD